MPDADSNSKQPILLYTSVLKEHVVYILYWFYLKFTKSFLTPSQSPWRIQVQEDSHPENVRVYGPGVEPTGLKAQEPTYFTVDCSEAGQEYDQILLSNITIKY